MCCAELSSSVTQEESQKQRAPAVKSGSAEEAPTSEQAVSFQFSMNTVCAGLIVAINFVVASWKWPAVIMAMLGPLLCLSRCLGRRTSHQLDYAGGCERRRAWL